jgi:hypothetical protein
MDDRAAMAVVVPGQRDAATNHPLAGDAVHLLADRPHEVTPTTRGDVVTEPGCVQVTQQLHHRRVAAGQVGAAQGGMLGAAQEPVGLGLEVLHGDAGERLQHPGG